MTRTKSTIIQLPGGSISVACDSVILKARGVRYASASRFQPPVPLTKWEEVMQCTGPAPIPPQMVPSRLDGVTGPITSGRIQDEDCLHLTVTTLTAALSDGDRLPVMVFLHGGAYVSGGADLECYDPSGLVKKGVTVVNVSYRLGVFGYLPIPGVAPANLGLLDQIAALEWIQTNITAFGGDPDNVTLFGQSAGADSIFCLMIAEGTERLFHRAILQSAPLGLRLADRDPMIHNLGLIAQERLASDIHPRTSEEMLSLQMELLLAAKHYSSRMMAFGPSLGHSPLPSLSQVPDRVTLAAQRIPILIGYTKNEAAPFVSMNDSLRSYFRIPLIGNLIKSLATWLISGTAFIWPAERFHKQYLKAGGKSSLLQFKWRPSQSLLGSTHCLDLPFLLGTWSTWKDAPMLHSPSSQNVVETLGDTLKNIWVTFARGNEQIPGTFQIIGDENRGDSVFSE